MINILSYVGMNLHSEVCLWTILGLVRTIFDATLFKVNANLKQVWQMGMPEQLSLPVQRAIRSMISGVMLVQCFTVYVYLASYIVLLYPVFLEERPALVLPWLLLAAIRKFLCELTSLALGLGTCVLLGPARPPCIKFLVIKIISIMPAFYKWMLVFSYYHTLKVAAVFKTFPAVLPPTDHDYCLELAIRRRRTKSLFGEEQLRRKLITNVYNERPTNRPETDYSLLLNVSPDSISEDEIKADCDIPFTTNSNRTILETGCYEDWFGSEVTIPRDTDRVLEQIGVMMLRIGAYMKKADDVPATQLLGSPSFLNIPKHDNIDCTTLPADITDTPLVGNRKCNTASYLQEYPQIFMKKHSEKPLYLQSEDKTSAIRTVRSQNENDWNDYATKSNKAGVDTPVDDLIYNEEDESTKKRDVSESSTKAAQERSNKSVMFKHKKSVEIPKPGEGVNEERFAETISERTEKDMEQSIESMKSLMNSANRVPSNSPSFTDDEINNMANGTSIKRINEMNSQKSSKLSLSIQGSSTDVDNNKKTAEKY